MFNIRQQQCFHEAYNSVHDYVKTLRWQKSVSATSV